MATALLITSLVTSVVGAGIQYQGQRNAAKAAEQAGKANQKLAELNARNQENESRENAGRSQTEARRRISSLRAHAAAGGTNLSGSSLDFLDESADRLQLSILDGNRQGQAGALAERHRGAQALYNGQAQASSLRNQATGTLIGGLGKIAGQASSSNLFN